MSEGEDRAPAIFAITQLMELVRRLPMKFFDVEDNRVQILESMQSELDELIILEEEEEEEVLGNDVLDDEEDAEDDVVDSSNVLKNA
jgi:hypothetical protein